MEIYGETLTTMWTGLRPDTGFRWTLIYINQLVYPPELAVGAGVTLPEPDGERGEERRPAWTMGYAYPFISPWGVGAEPRLFCPASRVLLRIYGGGGDYEPVLDDRFMIRGAEGPGAADPHLHLHWRGRGFVIHTLGRQTATAGLLAAGNCEAGKGISGIDIDFELYRLRTGPGLAAFVELVSWCSVRWLPGERVRGAGAQDVCRPAAFLLIRAGTGGLGRGGGSGDARDLRVGLYRMGLPWRWRRSIWYAGWRSTR